MNVILKEINQTRLGICGRRRLPNAPGFTEMADKTKKKFAKIYDKHIGQIYRFIFLKTGSKETAEDISSQVFTKGWRKFNLQGMSIKNVSAYLFQIARAEVANFYRDSSKFKVVSVQAVEEIIQDPALAQESSQEAIIARQDIKAALKVLEDDLQDIVIWHYVDGMAFKEIGRILNRPEGTVRVMAHRALKELKQVMSNETK